MSAVVKSNATFSKWPSGFEIPNFAKGDRVVSKWGEVREVYGHCYQDVPGCYRVIYKTIDSRGDMWPSEVIASSVAQ